VTDDLRDFLADLVTEDRWSSTTLGRLFTLAPSHWISVFALCEGLDRASERYRAILASGDSEIVATWLRHPIEPSNGFLILFYQDGEVASSVAIVTNAYLRHLAVHLGERT
jgi:hypothetical protein